MYENIIAFLLGKKTELTEDDLNEFMELLIRALDVDEEYGALEKQSVIENIVDSVAVKDQNERDIISNAIENILQFDEESEKSEEDIFVDESEEYVPLKNRKLRRGEFGKSKTTLVDSKEQLLEKKQDHSIKEEDEVDKPIKSDTSIDRQKKKNSVDETKKRIKIEEPNKIFKIEEDPDYPVFEFDIGDLEENNNQHHDGPEFHFKLDE